MERTVFPVSLTLGLVIRSLLSTGDDTHLASGQGHEHQDDDQDQGEGHRQYGSLHAGLSFLKFSGDVNSTQSNQESPRHSTFCAPPSWPELAPLGKRSRTVFG